MGGTTRPLRALAISSLTGCSSSPSKREASAFSRPDSYFHHYRDLSEDEAVERAEMLWDTINGPNLVENILPSRQRRDFFSVP